MSTSAPAHRRVVKIQRRILTTIRSEVRKVLGPQTAVLRRYYEAYKREFRGNFEHSSKEELLKECRSAHIVLMGDYHTFPQSQKAAQRLVEELIEWSTVQPPALALALEMLPSSAQEAVNLFLKDEISEETFLDRIGYDQNWGFPWEHFGPFLALAKQHKLPVVALNLVHENLETRDQHAAERLAQFCAAYPGYKVMAVYGDLHLARGHIPKYLKSKLKELGTRRRILTIFQNSEQIYWKLASDGTEHSTNVVKLHPLRFCIMNAAPWVKLQSYLEWAEASELFDIDEGAGPQLHEMAHDSLKNLAKALDFEVPTELDFTVQTVQSLGFLDGTGAISGLTRDEKKVVRYHVLGARSLFVPDANILYLPSMSINSICEGASLMLRSALSSEKPFFTNPSTQFYAAVLNSTVAFFGSKMLNHKRKCHLEDDWRLLQERTLPKGALPREKILKKVARSTLRHIDAQKEFLKSGKYRAPLSFTGPSRMSLFLETARALGELLGEKLYFSFVEGRYTIKKARKLFSEPFGSSRNARDIYLELVKDLEEAPLTHTSKEDLL